MNSILSNLIIFALHVFLFLFNSHYLKQVSMDLVHDRRSNDGPGYLFLYREPTQSVCVADCYFIVNVLDLPFASPIAIYR